MVAIINLTAPEATFFAAVAGAAGAAFVALVTIVFGWLTRRSERRHQLREIANRVAFDAWRQDSAMKSELFKSGASGDGLTILAPDGFVAQTLRLVEIAADTKLSAEEACTRIYKLRDDQ